MGLLHHRFATVSREAAEGLLEWVSIESNKEYAESFTSDLVKALDKAFPEGRRSRMQASRERMWGAYHCIRTSPTFTGLWREFLQRANIQALPIFYQSLTDSLFQNRIEYHFPLSCSPQQVGEAEAEGSRGGLLHISDDLYRVFVAMELDIRKHLRIEKASEMVSSLEGKLASSLLANEDVQFYWCIVCCEVPEEIAREILKSIAELWTTIRGFSFAKSYMEIYKQKTSKSLQRSKALRKNLFSGNMD